MRDGRVTRRTLLRKGAAGAALGATALAVPGLAKADLGVSHDSAQIGEIYELQAKFHWAKSHQDLDLMASLWAEDSTFVNGTTLYSGRAAIRAFFGTTGSWAHHRLSFVPSFKDQIDVHGDTAFLYFECHDVVLDSNDPAGAPGAIVTHLYNAGTIRRVKGTWLFQEMHGGTAPLSVTQIYYP
jgi:ketosteroid isomerase-like protein